MMLIWIEMDMINVEIPIGAMDTALKLRKTSRSRQFLIKLCPKFEHVQPAILKQEGSHDIDKILPELLAEETRLKSLSIHGDYSKDSALLAASDIRKERDMSKVQYYNCQEMRHLANNSKKRKVCNYCKETGHLITECRKRPQNKKKPPQAYVVVMSTSDTTFIAPTPPFVMHALPSIPSQSQSASFTPEFLQQVIQTLYASGFSKRLISKLLGY
ncbi:hypothetical protein AMTR_s00090p00121280 [Amborella trichopoda]|uniref:CCHC-type domain-containing protein n=1 Tax=Amborella trichopoda TaxID=13333 RepID=W1P3Z8_AMBTC|nr:hypothetical protein AMTR_s00090p00121280 [Amborella trichopoda]